MKTELRCIEKENLQPPSYLWNSLASSQSEAVRWLAQNERVIAYHKVGEGKTRIALTWIFYAVPRPKPLIVCSPGAFRQWADEIELLGLEKEIRPYFLSYGMLSRKESLILNFAKFNCVIVDELWLYKNYKSKRSIMIQQITRQLPCIGLSGSMVTARNIEDLYGQAKAVCLEQLIAPNITSFRKQYCIEIQNYAGFLDRFPRKGAIEKIQTKMAKHIHVYFPKDRLEIRNVNVNVFASTSQLKMRHKLVKEYFYEHQGKYGFTLEIKSAVALLVKLQEISDGFLRDGEGRILRVQSSKAARLRELTYELLDAGERVLVWVAFRESLEILREMLNTPVVILSGSDSFDSKAWQSKKANVCLATVGSGASLNDFADVRYSLFYSMRFSHLQVQQAKGRTNRRSSIGNCRYYYNLLTDGFPDRDVVEMTENSKHTEEMVIIATNKIIAEALK